MKTMTDETYKRFVKAIKKTGYKRLIYRELMIEIPKALREEFKDTKIDIKISLITGKTTRRAGLWKMEKHNDEARFYVEETIVNKWNDYVYGVKGSKWTVCKYIAMVVVPEPRVIFDDNGAILAEYEYYKAISEWKTQLVVYYKNEAYHCGWRKNHYSQKYENRIIKESINKIKERRKKQAESLMKKRLEKKKFNEMIKDVYVTIEDSISAGNCKSQTEEFAKKISRDYNIYLPFAIKAVELLKIRDDVYTRRAIMKAYEKKLAILH